jgi:oligopeptide transport system substrate-binding protein
MTFPFAGFLEILGHNALFIYPQEAFDEYGQDLATKAIGTGAFTLDVFKSGEIVVLRRNPNYWGRDEHGNQLPYLDAIQISFVKDKKSELIKFKNHELDMVFTLPIEMYSEVMTSLDAPISDNKQDFKPQVKPSMSIHYLAFQHEHEVFKEIKVRPAFNLAIDRESLINRTLQGEGTPGIYGIIPPAFSSINKKNISKIEFNPAKAKELLSESGYPNGVGFPELTLELSSGRKNHELVAQVIPRMLAENLGIKLNMRVLPMAQLLDNSESGKSAIWRDGRVADYPDPEKILRVFVSDKSENSGGGQAYLNSVR